MSEAQEPVRPSGLLRNSVAHPADLRPRPSTPRKGPFILPTRRQQEARQTIAQLGLSQHVEFVLERAQTALTRYPELEFVLIDCEKEDYVAFFDQLLLAGDTIVVADNILSHRLGEYVDHVRARPGVQSVTLPIGKGLEVSRIVSPASW